MKGNCKDTAGLATELLKAVGATIQRHLWQLLCDTIKPRQNPPDQWKRTTIPVLSGRAIQSSHTTTDQLP